MTGYQGLGAYASQPAKSNLDRRPGESEYSAQRRRDFWSKSIQEPTEEDWTAHRNIQDNVVGVDRGLFGTSTGQQRAAALGGRGMDGSQQVQKLGHITGPSVPGSVSIPRILATDIKDERVIPHLKTGTSSGDGWH